MAMNAGDDAQERKELEARVSAAVKRFHVRASSMISLPWDTHAQTQVEANMKQLKQLLIEIEHLKSRTKVEDHEKFDELVSQRRNEALKEIQMYQGEYLMEASVLRVESSW